MKSRERLSRTFYGGKPDRTPITLFITDTDIVDGLGDFVLKEKDGDSLNDLIKFHEILNIDIMLRISTDIYEPLAFNLSNEQWKNIWEPLQQCKYLVHKIVTPEGEIREVFNVGGEEFHGDYFKDWMKLRNIRIEAFIKTEKDLELIKKYRPPLPKYAFPNIAHAVDKLGDRGIVLPRASSSVFNYAAGLMNLEDLLIAPLLKSELYNQLMDLCLKDTSYISSLVVKSGGDVVRVIGNIGNGGIVSNKFYLDYIYPYEKSLIYSITSSGGKILFHNCGKCLSLLPIYNEMLDGHALESLSTSDTGGDITSLNQARKLLSNNIVMIGNFDQIQLLRNGNINQIKQRVREIFTEIKNDDKFIFSTSDSLIPGTPLENLKALIDTCAELI
ncbi:MAG: uroporphyrinogen decarboxylase family protein [Phycisphaerales bacterium]